jgi:putative membrane protein
MKEYILRFIKGMIIGIANIIPGVSGGTMALMLNIYEPLIEGIHNISFKTLMSFFKLFTFKKENIKEFNNEMKKINFSLLLLIVLGAGFAIVLFSGTMTFLLKSYQVPTYGFFFGLILISIVIPFKLIKKIDIRVIVCFIVALVLIVGLTALETDERKIEKEEQSIALDKGELVEESDYSFTDYITLALSGAVSISTMVMPGVSGSFMMLLMGKYFMILEAISQMNIPVLVVFAIGAIFGLLLFTRLLNYLLKKHYNTTMGFLTGLVVGSLWAIWPFKEIHTLSNGETIMLSNILPKTFGSTELLTIGMFLLGAIIVIIMIRLEKKENKAK